MQKFGDLEKMVLKDILDWSLSKYGRYETDPISKQEMIEDFWSEKLFDSGRRTLTAKR